jgi:hypothetical protein
MRIQRLPEIRARQTHSHTARAVSVAFDSAHLTAPPVRATTPPHP